MTATLGLPESVPPDFIRPVGRAARLRSQVKPAAHRLWRGPTADPVWGRPALFGLLAVTAALYLVNLTASGWANAFYSAAAQAGSVSWKAFFFGSSDAANAITVDKSPASLWFMALSVRAFGVNSFAILLPQALMGGASVGVLFAAVKQVTSPAAGLLAAAILALTPVAALMFRFNNPDALMVLGLVLAGWAMTKAIADGRTKWLLWCGAFVGVAFLAKMMQAFLVLPGFGLAYLIAGPPRPARRIRQLLGALATMVVAGGWWAVVASLWPATDRPYIGGSQTNSVWDLLLGYNGFGRLTGDETGSVGWSDQSSLTKLISSEMGGQIAWLLPAALIGLIAVLVIRGHRARTDPLRASGIVWGGWLLVTGVTFSLMEGIIHPYYTVALAPAIAALVAIGVHQLWQHRDSVAALGTLAGTVALSGVWAKILLARTSNYLLWLGMTVLLAGLAAAGLIVLAGLVPGRRLLFTPVATILALVAVLGGPTAYTISTVSTAHIGALPSAGPTTQGGFGQGGLGQGGLGRGGTGRGGTGQGGTGRGAAGIGGTAGAGGQGRGQGSTTPGATGQTLGAQGGGMGGLLGTSTPAAALVAALETDAARYTWAAAVTGSNNAAGYQLATGLPVMAVGGFNGTDPAPTLTQFQALVAEGKVHYYILATLGGGNGTSTSGSNDAVEIAAWVAATYSSTTIGGETVYDLTVTT